MFRKGHSVVVRYRDVSGNLWAKILPSTTVADQGTDINLSLETLESGVDYGFPFEAILPERTITPEMIQNAMRAHGVWTYEDLLEKPNQASAAILSVIRLVQGELQKGARDALGR
jgi:hypothetical protein